MRPPRRVITTVKMRPSMAPISLARVSPSSGRLAASFCAARGEQDAGSVGERNAVLGEVGGCLGVVPLEFGCIGHGVL